MPSWDVQDFVAHWSAAELIPQIKRVKPTDLDKICEALVTMAFAHEKNGKFSR